MKKVATNGQNLVRWDVLEDQLIRFINKNVIILFDDEIKREVAKITNYKKNLGQKIIADQQHGNQIEYDINNHILNTAGLFNINIFASKRKLMSSIIANIFGKLGVDLLDKKVEKSIDSFWRPKLHGAIECLWLGWYVSMQDFIRMFQKKGITDTIRQTIIQEAQIAEVE